jgi:uncharacterized protein YjbI with pentapeptide repeats
LLVASGDNAVQNDATRSNLRGSAHLGGWIFFVFVHGTGEATPNILLSRSSVSVLIGIGTEERTCLKDASLPSVLRQGERFEPGVSGVQTSFVGARLRRASFIGADTAKADFRGATFLEVRRIWRAKHWDTAKFSPEFREKLEAAVRDAANRKSARASVR